MNSTPKGERVHIALFGRRNAGKSSLINAITNQDLAIVSPVKGTTTDPVSKAMEILPIGPVLLTDTPGLDDPGTLGHQRVEKAMRVLEQTDLAIIVADGEAASMDLTYETRLMDGMQKKDIPCLLVFSKYDQWQDKTMSFSKDADLYVSAKNKYHIPELRELMASKLARHTMEKPLVADLLTPGDQVVLVVPIDSSAPKGRLILPQQQVIRDVLEADATAIVCKDIQLASTLERMQQPPKLVITDSQVLASVAKVTPTEIPLTSFSILFSRYKGDLETQIAGIAAIQLLEDNDPILLAEGCTHHRQCEDIGTVKIPKWLQENTGKQFRFSTCNGGEFPSDLAPFKLVIHCGGCTLNKKEMAHRIALCKEQHVPVVNYGTLIAHLKGVLERSIEPFK